MAWTVSCSLGFFIAESRRSSPAHFLSEVAEKRLDLTARRGLASPAAGMRATLDRAWRALGAGPAEPAGGVRGHLVDWLVEPLGIKAARGTPPSGEYFLAVRALGHGNFRSESIKTRHQRRMVSSSRRIIPAAHYRTRWPAAHPGTGRTWLR